MKKKLLSLSVLVAAGLASYGCSQITPPVSQAAAQESAPATKNLNPLEQTGRPAKDKARDAAYKPLELFAFAGITPGMTVADIGAGGGYVSELLAYAVGEKGRVLSQNDTYIYDVVKGLEAEYKERLGRLANMKDLGQDVAQLTLPARSVDVFWLSTSFHDIYNNAPGQALQFVKMMKTALKPNGVVLVIDHFGDKGQDNKALHRIEREKVLETFQQAGFKLQAESDLLRHKEDLHQQKVFALGGKTDRFILKFTQ